MFAKPNLTLESSDLHFYNVLLLIAVSIFIIGGVAQFKIFSRFSRLNFSEILRVKNKSEIEDSFHLTHIEDSDHESIRLEDEVLSPVP